MGRRRRNTPDFNRSNKIHALRFKPSAEERSITEKLIQNERAGSREASGQKLLNAICGRLRISPVRLRVQDAHQPHKKHDGRLAYKEYGAYYLEEQVIRIANLTAVRGKVVAGKTFFDTLIHELMHHIDRKFLKIPSTPHSPGFYSRIDDLKRKLLGGGPLASAEEKNAGQWEAPPKGLLAAVERAAREAREARRMNEAESVSGAAPAGAIPPGARVPRWTPPGSLFSKNNGGDIEKETASPARNPREGGASSSASANGEQNKDAKRASKAPRTADSGQMAFWFEDS